MIARILGILAISLTVSSPITFADHLPDHLQARGHPETILARINLKNATIAKIMKLYGQPTEVKKEDPSLPNSSGSIDYYWRKKHLNLHVQIEFLIDQPKWKPVVLVEVACKTSRRFGQTGAGLQLGNNLSDLKRVYGRRFYLRDVPKFKIYDAMVQWHREEYSLVAILDRRDRITKLSLFAPE